MAATGAPRGMWSSIVMLVELLSLERLVEVVSTVETYFWVIVNGLVTHLFSHLGRCQSILDSQVVQRDR